MAKDEVKLGRCPLCDANMDLVGKAHNCRHRQMQDGLQRDLDRKVSPPKAKMRGKAVVIADKKPAAESLKQHVEEIKKRGRPAKRTPEERKAYRAELMRKKRAK
jgi:hypothetical protein